MPMARTMAAQRVAEKLCSTSVNSVVSCVSGDLDATCVCTKFSPVTGAGLSDGVGLDISSNIRLIWAPA